MTQSNDDAAVLAPVQLMAPEFVLQQARELRRHSANEKRPYTAGVIGDCIATIETLQAQLDALSRSPALPAGMEVRGALEAAYQTIIRLTARDKKEFDEDERRGVCHFLETETREKIHRETIEALAALPPRQDSPGPQDELLWRHPAPDASPSRVPTGKSYTISMTAARPAEAHAGTAGTIEGTLRAIIIRCEEGDKKSDWLPIINRLAKEALAALASQSPSARGEK